MPKGCNGSEADVGQHERKSHHTPESLTDLVSSSMQVAIVPGIRIIVQFRHRQPAPMGNCAETSARYALSSEPSTACLVAR